MEHLVSRENGTRRHHPMRKFGTHLLSFHPAEPARTKASDWWKITIIGSVEVVPPLVAFQAI